MSGDDAIPVTRRALIGGIGGGLAATTLAVTPVWAEDIAKYDQETDVIVCGGGPAGLATALFSRWHGHEVTLLEKSGSVGGTAAKAAFWYWMPNNKPMRDKGLTDPKPDFLKLVARLTSPRTYSADAPRFGLSEWQHAMCSAFYDSASDAAELLSAKGALPYRHVDNVPDYWKELPENKAPFGRVLVPDGINEYLADGGRVATRTMTQAARRDGVEIKTSHRVQRVLLDLQGRASGVEVLDASGIVKRIRARKAVVFATGGFTHDPELRSNFLSVPVFGGCAVQSNEGDLVRISSELGIKLRNMNNAWLAPISLEKAIAKDGALSGIFAMSGDSMIIVNKDGRRVGNEKQPYNELGRSFAVWDGEQNEYANLLQFIIWDQRAQDKCASPFFGSPIVPAGSDDSHVISGATLSELTSNIAKRLTAYRSETGVTLSSNFVANLESAIARFNAFAKEGHDLDFHRGEKAIEKFVAGPPKETGQKNATMWPISDNGPYHAAILAAGTLDTKGGPQCDPDGRMLNTEGQPIEGLYGVGNCVASVSGAAYWAGGGTIGPLLTFAYRASNAIAST
ncbi:MAG: FAD-dependent oxidoreductase [Alphaproteobacteria bacterium]|nr:FAD-dependent oxidoreductase [Alphaproteobacteria bacterium]